MNNGTSSLQFPDGFFWGVGTSAYQVEGDSVNTQWYEFENGGGIKTGDRSGKAADWWNNAEQDFDIAQNMGLNSLRLSVSWARIEPEEGVFNPEAIERYRQMLAALIERNIRPIVCLHHFSHPVWFEKKGAFLSKSCVEDFGRFVKFTVTELYDLCSDWITFNEPNVYALEGYLEGDHPPAKTGRPVLYFRVLGNMGRCHAAAYYTIHKLQHDAMVSFANHFIIFTEVKNHMFDRLAARIASDSFNNVFINMITGKKVPLLSSLLGNCDHVRDTWDFVGVNIYGGTDVSFDTTQPGMAFVRRSDPKGKPTGDPDPGGKAMFGEIYPQGISIVVDKLAKYNKPFFILENGVPDKEDKLRPWVIAKAVRTMYDLIQKGYDIIGYHHWTLVDNFEWALGYSMKFGLVEMDPMTQQRKPRPSAAFFSEIAKANALTPTMVKKYVPEAMDEIFPKYKDHK
ncbi:MAG: family 1 glycosylhydrolase [Dehalococcoidia bacterium]|jgi:beta-glucosidase